MVDVHFRPFYLQTKTKSFGDSAGQRLPGARVKRGFTPLAPAGVKTPADPAGVGVKIFFRGFDPGGVGVEIFFRGFDPAGSGSKMFSGVLTPAGSGSKKKTGS